MRYFVLLWQPTKFLNYPNLVEEFEQNGWVELSWSCGVRRDVTRGDVVILRRTGAGAKGIIGLGTVRRGTYQANWADDENGSVGNFVDVDWEVLSIEPLLLRDDSRFSDVDRLWTAMAGGIQLDALDGARLANALRTASSPKVNLGRLLVREGERTLQRLNVLGRDVTVRQLCIDHHGAVCAVCGFDPGNELGAEFASLMDVHHLQPLAEADEVRLTDPINDCRPLCPTCHRMAHHGMPIGSCRSIDVLQRLRSRS